MTTVPSLTGNKLLSALKKAGFEILQPMAQVAQFYFVAVGHAGERRLRDARFL